MCCMLEPWSRTGWTMATTTIVSIACLEFQRNVDFHSALSTAQFSFVIQSSAIISFHTTTSDPMIKSIKFASVPVSDQDRSLEFYTEKLGFKVATDQPFDEAQRWIELRIPGAETRLVLFTPPGHEDRIGTPTHITFESDDVETLYRTLSTRGVIFAGEPQKADWGMFAIMHDPDGNQFVISSKS